MSKNTLRCGECGDEVSLYLHGRCHPSSPTWAVLSGDVLTIECAQCKKVVVRLKIAPVLAGDGDASEYDWRLITPDDLPGFDDLLLQDMTPPYGAWSVTNKHYNYAVSYERWIELGYRWFSKMRVPKDWVPPREGI